MIASRTGRAGVRSGPTRFGGSSSATIGSISAHNSSGTRQIVGNGSRSADSLAMSHLLVSRRCSPHARLEIASKVHQKRGRDAGTGRFIAVSGAARRGKEAIVGTVKKKTGKAK